MVRRARAIVILAFLGAADAVYGLWQHYAPTGTAFCNVNDVISCDIVNKSVYSEIFGVPVAAIGLLGFLALAALALAVMWRPALMRPLFWIALGGLAFQICLTAIELIYLRALCPICIVSQILIASIAILAIPLKKPQPANGIG